MSIRQRTTYKFSEHDDENENRVLDEQEQEELIERLKEESQTRNAQHLFLMQIVIGLSFLLQVIYFLSDSRHPPIAALFPDYLPPNFGPIPLSIIFILLNMFIHLNLSVHLLPQHHHIRRIFPRIYSSPYVHFIPLTFPILFGLSFPAPFVSLLIGNGLLDVAWWLETTLLTWFVYAAQSWIGEESEGIRNLESMRYDVKGA
ncbi:hypothetical protein C8Q75DRAFT_764724 [Abortiporus biennis]|nr:hypothetical protein C8Q75DRAFT_764724 [Abortiporus biennis]